MKSNNRTPNHFKIKFDEIIGEYFRKSRKRKTEPIFCIDQSARICWHWNIPIESAINLYTAEFPEVDKELIEWTVIEAYEDAINTPIILY